jgi:hypothetical protein
MGSRAMLAIVHTKPPHPARAAPLDLRPEVRPLVDALSRGDFTDAEIVLSLRGPCLLLLHQEMAEEIARRCAALPGHLLPILSRVRAARPPALYAVVPHPRRVGPHRPGGRPVASITGNGGVA